MNKKNNTLKTLSFIYKNKKSSVFVAAFSGIIKAIQPYVYIFTSAEIVNLLTLCKNLKLIFFTAFSAVFLQMILSILGYWLSNLQMENQDWFNMYEKIK